MNPRPQAAADHEEDAVVRTALRGLLPPEHHPDFWDQLAGTIDDLDDREGRPTAADAPPAALMPLPGERDHGEAAHPPRHRSAAHRPAEADHPPRRAPLRARPDPRRVHVGPSAPSPSALTSSAPAPIAASVSAPPIATGRPSADSRMFVGADDGAARSATSAAGRAGGASARHVADPLERLRVEHDEATVPSSMRNPVNAVLLAVAVAALAVAAIAGMSLVRQRNDLGAPAPAPESVADLTEFAA